MNGGHVVLDTTGMVYDRLAAYYEDVCEKVGETKIKKKFSLKSFFVAKRGAPRSGPCRGRKPAT